MALLLVVKMARMRIFTQRSVSTALHQRLTALLAIAALVLGMSGCDMIKQKMGFEDPVEKAARTEADGKAVGGACRQSGRAIEDCYSIYSWLPRASVYEGWRDMDAYMRDNKLETVEPQLPPVAPPGPKKKTKTAEETKPDNAKPESAKPESAKDH